MTSAPKRLPFLKVLFCLFLICFNASKTLIAQNKMPIDFGKMSLADFDLPKNSVVDSSSNAVIISNIGNIEFVGNKNSNWVSYVFTRHTRIKILSKKSYELATVKIRLFGKDEKADKLDDLQASTYNIENGVLHETKLNNTDIFTEHLTKNVDEQKFTMPDVKEGSVIEYSYKLTSYRYSDLPDWGFQNLLYPCLYSEIHIGIPDLFRFLVARYGIDSFTNVISKDTYTTLHMSTVNVGTTIHNHTWIMKDIPAFKLEDHINEPRNYMDRIEFIEAQEYNGRDVQGLAINWKNTEDQLLTDKQFGSAISFDGASNLNNAMQKICGTDGDLGKAARELYYYVRDNFTCVPNDNIYIWHDLYDVNKARKGSVAELNMLLIALLKQRGITASPVILATRSYGNNPENYPVLDKLNYVICMMSMANQTIFLDASDPQMGFGKLPLDCYNGHARIIDKQHSGPIYLNPSAIKEENVTSILLVNNEKGSGESGSVQSTFGYYKSQVIRSDIQQAGNPEKYLKKIQLNYGDDVSLANFKIDSLTSADNPIKLNYDIDYKSGFDGDVIYFNPVLTDSYKGNPCKDSERKYPFELPYPINKVYDITMDIPNGFQVDELPKSVQVNFNGTDGIFIYQMLKDAYTVQLHMLVKINKTIFAPEDYISLRNFFATIVKKQAEQVVFKKK
ncbi:MAG: DUF3857 domain-containing protein [Ginsengibacter sp.]